MQSIDVPLAFFDSSFRRYINAGTSIKPPPVENSPEMKPASKPIIIFLIVCFVFILIVCVIFSQISCANMDIQGIKRKIIREHGYGVMIDTDKYMI